MPKSTDETISTVDAVQNNELKHIGGDVRELKGRMTGVEGELADHLLDCARQHKWNRWILIGGLSLLVLQGEISGDYELLKLLPGGEQSRNGFRESGARTLRHLPGHAAAGYITHHT